MSEKQALTKESKVDLSKIKDSLDSRFSTLLLNDDLLEIENKFGLPKIIYVNSKGEIWSSKADGVFKENKLPEIKKIIRTIAASSLKQTFKVDELFRIFYSADKSGSCGCSEGCSCPDGCDCGMECDYSAKPQLNEDDVLKVGNDVLSDLIKESKIAELKLSPEDQEEVAKMAFIAILEDKEKKLSEFKQSLAPKIAKYLNDVFQNLTFVDMGSNEIRVMFDPKLASDHVTREEFVEFLKEAAKGSGFNGFYRDLVTNFSTKVSAALPDYFKVREVVISAVLEQLNGLEKQNQ